MNMRVWELRGIPVYFKAFLLEYATNSNTRRHSMGETSVGEGV
jgi:hypothetical protein